jgi:hypothetical protein
MYRKYCMQHINTSIEKTSIQYKLRWTYMKTGKTNELVMLFHYFIILL